MHRKRIFFAGAFIALSVLSCSKNEGWGVFDSTVISPGVMLSKSQPSSGSKQAKSAVVSPENDFLEIREYVSDISEIENAEAVTKGVEITTSNFASEFGSFRTMAFADVEGNHMNDFNLNCSKSGSNWVWEGYAPGDGPKWRASVPMTMWAYAPVSTTGMTTPTVPDWENGTYTGLQFDYAVPTPLESHKDIVVAYNVEQRNFTESGGSFIMQGGQTPKYDVTFRHALSAVKFTFNPKGMTGVDIKSMKISALSPSGSCTATGRGSNAITFNWTNLGTPIDYEYEFDSTTSISNGYMYTGTGVMFMVPQTQSTVTIEVEFTKQGSTDIVKRTTTIPGGVSWEAGKYYHYEISAEIHVSGEIAFGKETLTATNFKSSTSGLLMAKSVPVKGAKHVVVVMDGYTHKDNGASTLILTLAPNGVKPNTTCTDIMATAPTTFTFNLLDTDLPASPDLNTVYHFGLNGSTPETYQSYYRFNGSDKTITDNTTYYLVFDVEGLESFNIAYFTTSSNNSAEFKANIRCFMFLDVDLG